MRALLLTSAMLVGVGEAEAGGVFSTGLPTVGGGSYCGSYNVLGTSCGSTIPAAPAGVTGTELIPADTGLANGAFPQSVAIPSSMLTSAVNKLYGGDLDVALSQRPSTVKGVASLAGVAPTAAIMGNDGFWYLNQSSQTTVTIASAAADGIAVKGTTKAFRVARPSGQSPTTATYFGQTLDQSVSQAFLGNNAVLSFWAKVGATYSDTTGGVSVQINYSTAAAAAATQATLGYAGSQGSKYALAVSGQAGGPTGFATAVAIPCPGFDPGASVTAVGVVTIPLTTTWTRYCIAAPIPAATAAGTAITDVSIAFGTNPAATTSVTTDWVEMDLVQLEAKPGTVTAQLPNGVVAPSNEERRPSAIEQAIEYSYWWYLFEAQVAGGITTYAQCGTVVANTTTNCLVYYPVPMRLTPALKFTDGFQIFTTVAETAVGACTGLALSTSYATVANNRSFLMTCTSGTMALGVNFLTSLGTTGATGIISASALP